MAKTNKKKASKPSAKAASVQRGKPKAAVKKGAKKSVAPKSAPKPKVAPKKPTKNAPKLSPLEIAMQGLRLEFKQEIDRSFAVCMAAIEQSSNLMESRLVSVLGEMRNLVSGATSSFQNGKLKSVVSADGEERTDYAYQKDGTIVSRTYRGDKLRFEIVHNKFGNPISGKMFGKDGKKVEKAFSYNGNGEVATKKTKKK